MKIVKRVEPRKPWLGLWHCSQCRSVIDLEQGDDERVVQFHFAESIRDDDWVELLCPVCDGLHRFYKGNL